MDVLYAHEPLDSLPSESIFLAGPSPRKEGGYDWRLEAVDILQKLGYGGTVFIPLPRDGQWSADYYDQVEWELAHLDMASVIAFWIPRDLKELPAFTTNVEYGLYAKSGKVVLGFPEKAQKMKYISHLAKKYKVSVFSTLQETLKGALTLSESDLKVVGTKVEH